MVNVLQERLALLLFTYNRPQKLQRVLSYYSKHDVPVFVADGSDQPYPEALGKNVSYFHVPINNIVVRCLRVLDKINTKYVCLASDDDFISPVFLAKACDLMDSDSDVSSVFGRCYGFDEMIFSGWKRLYKDKPVLDQETFQKRLKALFYNYSFITYSPVRTELQKEFFQDLVFLEEKKLEHLIFFELMHAARLVIAGKIAKIDAIHMVRELTYFRYPTLQESVANNKLLLPRFDDLLRKWSKSVHDNMFMHYLYDPFNAKFSKRNMLRAVSKLLAPMGWNSSICKTIDPKDVTPLEEIRHFLNSKGLSSPKNGGL